MKKIIMGLIFAALLLSLVNTGTVLAEEPLPDEFQIPWRIEGNGTHFELNSSDYLNVTLDSSKPIKLVLESIPEMVTMQLESISGATSAEIILGGFMPLTTYHRYEDDYHNHTAFTTDANGNYTYTQDLSTAHFVFIQPRKSTKFISDNATGGDCTLIGTWNLDTKTCTLTTDLTETIQIDSNGVTLDGNGRTITGAGTGYGVYLYGRTGVAIKNLKVKSFAHGIYLGFSSSNTLTDNTVSSNNIDGIFLERSRSNVLTSNTASSNNYAGIYLISSSGNTLTDNTASSNNYGISWLSGGIFLDTSSYNTLAGNTASSNRDYGIYIYSAGGNTLTNNAANSNGNGIVFGHSSGNTVSSNNNGTGIYLYATSNSNIFKDDTISSNGIGISFNPSCGRGHCTYPADNKVYNLNSAKS